LTAFSLSVEAQAVAEAVEEGVEEAVAAAEEAVEAAEAEAVEVAEGVEAAAVAEAEGAAEAVVEVAEAEAVAATAAGEEGFRDQVAEGVTAPRPEEPREAQAAHQWPNSDGRTPHTTSPRHLTDPCDQDLPSTRPLRVQTLPST